MRLTTFGVTKIRYQITYFLVLVADVFQTIWNIIRNDASFGNVFFWVFSGKHICFKVSTRAEVRWYTCKSLLTYI